MFFEKKLNAFTQTKLAEFPGFHCFGRLALFTAQRHVSAVYAVVVCVCVFVCVHLSHVGIVSKRRNADSWKQRSTIAQVF